MEEVDWKRRREEGKGVESEGKEEGEEKSGRGMRMGGEQGGERMGERGEGLGNTGKEGRRGK